ncbi:tRNA (N6-isopentenyl adenosine(37)-C2)-methylthiotransferase MiaB [Chloroflexota bacterium]
MPRYHLWTIGCQMNKAESRRIAGLLASAGFDAGSSFEDADLIVLNTCVVRQSAEDRIIGTLGLLEGVKRERPDVNILVTGCFASLDRSKLQRRFPHVDLFFGPGEYHALEEWLFDHASLPRPKDGGCAPAAVGSDDSGVSAFIPIIQGCNNFCTYCIVPYTRGRETSRTPEDIVAEVRGLVDGGTKEVVLLGQNVDSYGHDLPEKPDLADLLEMLEPTEGLERIRFLTNHPKDMSQKLIDTMARLEKVCEHLDLALQSGDNELLRWMGRGYSVEQYSALVGDIRAAMPSVSISTDIIVGFPGETDEQSQNTYAALEHLRCDVVHVAAYSPRTGTVASRKYADSVPAAVKSERLHRVEELQERVAGAINAGYEGRTEKVLFQGMRRGRWYGRTRTDKLVFVTSEQPLVGQLVEVSITRTSPWALQGDLV